MTSKKVIVVGAGIAGLAACNRLLEHQIDTVILEARDYCGGRICPDTTIGRHPISRGAAWIHGIDNNPIAIIAKELNVKMFASNPEQFIKYDRHGFMITQDIIKQFEDKFSDMLYKAKESAWHAASDMPLSRALTPFITASPFSEVECDLFQNKLRYFAGYLGADYTLLSARNFDMEEVWPGDHCFLEDGYASIIKYLSKNCSVQLNTIVSNITLQNRHVEITTNQGKYTADAVIVTLPLGVLKSNAVTFDPPLPKHKQDAINRMGMGLLNVNAFKFTKMFWPNHLQAMHFAQFDETSIASFFNLHYFMDEPILLGYIGGERAKALEDYDDARILQKVMDNFKIVFGPHLIETEAYFIGRFGTCPFSRGAYSYPAVGSGPVDYETLSEPINNQLFFAGEATSSKYFATTHGAYLSGIREANRIIQQTTLG